MISLDYYTILEARRILRVVSHFNPSVLANETLSVSLCREINNVFGAVRRCFDHVLSKVFRGSVFYLLPGISRQKTIFLSDLRFLVQRFNGSIHDCSTVQSAVCLSNCLAAAPVPLLRATRYFVLFSCEIKICTEIVVFRMFAVFLNGLSGKVRNIFSVYFFYSQFKD